MDNKISLELDNATIRRRADGTVTIEPKQAGGCVNIVLLISTAIVTLGGLAASINGVIQLFNPVSESNPGIIIFGLFASAMFGSYALYLYSKMRSGQKQEQIIISPILNIVRIGNREIPFNDVAEVTAHDRSVKSYIGSFAIRAAKMNGIGNLRFTLVLSNGDVVELGEVAVDKSKLDERETEIITFLKEVLKKT